MSEGAVAQTYQCENHEDYKRMLQELGARATSLRLHHDINSPLPLIGWVEQENGFFMGVVKWGPSFPLYHEFFSQLTRLDCHVRPNLIPDIVSLWNHCQDTLKIIKLRGLADFAWPWDIESACIFCNHVAALVQNSPVIVSIEFIPGDCNSETKLFERLPRRWRGRLSKKCRINRRAHRNCRLAARLLLCARKYDAGTSLNVLPKDVVVLLAKAVWCTRLDTDDWQ